MTTIAKKPMKGPDPKGVLRNQRKRMQEKL